MKLHAYPVLFVFASVVLLISCKKGDIGPEGPQGPQGNPGSPNVIYSEWFNATPWKKDTVFSIFGFSYTKPAPKITQAVIDSGTVLTFGKLLGYNPTVWATNQIGQLPISLTYQQGSVTTDTWSAYASTGNLKIRFVNDNNIYSSIATTHQFRYIIIPGGVPSGRTRALSYEEICRKYNIPE